MSRSIGTKPRDALKLRLARERTGIAKGALRLAISSNEKAVAGNNRTLLDRLEAENAALRAKAIDLLLQNQVLREGDPNGRTIRAVRPR
jgi:hypothetical protein